MQKNLDIEKFNAEDGYITFCRIIFVSECQKISFGNASVCQEVSGVGWFYG